MGDWERRRGEEKGWATRERGRESQSGRKGDTKRSGFRKEEPRTAIELGRRPATVMQGRGFIFNQYALRKRIQGQSTPIKCRRKKVKLDVRG